MKKVLLFLLVLLTVVFAANSKWYMQTDFDGFALTSPVIGYNLNRSSSVYGMLRSSGAEY